MGVWLLYSKMNHRPVRLLEKTDEGSQVSLAHLELDPSSQHKHCETLEKDPSVFVQVNCPDDMTTVSISNFTPLDSAVYRLSMDSEDSSLTTLNHISSPVAPRKVCIVLVIEAEASYPMLECESDPLA